MIDRHEMTISANIDQFSCALKCLKTAEYTLSCSLPVDSAITGALGDHQLYDLCVVHTASKIVVAFQLAGESFHT